MRKRRESLPVNVGQIVVLLDKCPSQEMVVEVSALGFRVRGHWRVFWFCDRDKTWSTEVPKKQEGRK